MKKNQQKMGFSSQAKRFLSPVSLHENPGPGSYDCVSSAEFISPSFSKKGTTGFVASKAARPLSYQHRGTPGPDAYNLQSSCINKYDFNTGASRAFRLPVAVKVDQLKHQTPAPNQYDVSYRSPQSFSSVVGTSAFLSKATRDSLQPKKHTPSPCHYDVNNSATKQSSTAVSSPFKSRIPRIPAQVKKCVPGPGAYNLHQAPRPVMRTILPRGHYLALAGPPIFVPKDPPLPGPGHYDIKVYGGPSKHPIPTAAFASRTQRTLQISKGTATPGPGFYDPQILPKRSFIYSHLNVWIPV